jgi:transcription elongation GreA/GreB family factor
MDFLALKQKVYQECSEWLENKITIATQAMKHAQEAANSEEKSSAGDKYETGRAMSQNERDMYARQLAECLRQKQFLKQIDPERKLDRVAPGALVLTPLANYFIAISAGNIVIENQCFFAVSPETPIGRLLLQKTPGSTFSFNGKESYISSVW